MRTTKKRIADNRPFTLAAFSITAALLAQLNVAGCGPMGATVAPGNFVGVTTGGEEDNAAARSQIRAGYIPNPDAITVEGFMSEHDIPLPRPQDPDEIFASFSFAYRRPFGEPAPMADVFLGFGTTIDLDAFKRPPLNLVVVIDRSGSMDYAASESDGRSKLDAVKAALAALVNQLNADDLLTLISFNTGQQVLLNGASGDDKSAATKAIDGIRPLGNTDIFGGLNRGYELIAEHATSLRSDRVILFTDALPNQGPEGSPEFVALITEKAAENVGFTLMGVGVDFGTELAKEISYVRNANSFFLAEDNRIATIFDKDFNFLVTPAAYDVVLDVTVPAEVGIRNVYGVADYQPGKSGARIEVPTLFFSRREGGGAVVIRLSTYVKPTFDQDTSFCAATLSFTLPDGTKRSSEYMLTIPKGTTPLHDLPADPATAYYSDPSARRAAILLDTVLALRGASIAGAAGRYWDGISGLEVFLPHFDQATLGLSDRLSETDRGLAQERALITDLIANLESARDNSYNYWPFY